jgi:hypothetical protein
MVLALAVGALGFMVLGPLAWIVAGAIGIVGLLMAMATRVK